jgi:hypothetical protein
MARSSSRTSNPTRARQTLQRLEHCLSIASKDDFLFGHPLRHLAVFSLSDANSIRIVWKSDHHHSFTNCARLNLHGRAYPVRVDPIGRNLRPLSACTLIPAVLPRRPATPSGTFISPPAFLKFCETRSNSRDESDCFVPVGVTSTFRECLVLWFALLHHLG